MALIPVVRLKESNINIIIMSEKIKIASNIQDRHTIYLGNPMRGKLAPMKIFITWPKPAIRAK